MSKFQTSQLSFLIFLFYSSRKQVETATEEIFGTDTSLDATPVHPHIVSRIELFQRKFIF